MQDSAREAIAAFHEWNNAWNAGDIENQVSHMHFPHIRLSGNNEFQIYASPNEFRRERANGAARLIAEGWHHTATLSINAIQAGPEKVHLVIRQSRQHGDGTKYKGFDTLWIFTRIDGRWGAQFRSSFLK